MQIFLYMKQSNENHIIYIYFFFSPYQGPSSINDTERESHARGVYPTQNTSRMETERKK